MRKGAIVGLMRVENCAMASIAVLIGFIVAGSGTLILDPRSWTINQIVSLILAIVSVFFITGAGNTINDYYDRGTDRKNAPKRPIPSGAISPEASLKIAIVTFVFGVIMSFFINLNCFLLASFNAITLFFYGRNLKSSVFIGNVVVSYLTASTFVYGALIIGNPTTTVFLALLAFLANVGREIIGDIEDMKGDKKAGIKTLALRIGKEKSWLYGRIYILAAVFLSPVPYIMGLLGFFYLAPVAIADTIFFASVLTKNARRNQELTKIGIFFGLVAFLIGALIK